jgi:hypothetical protein
VPSLTTLPSSSGASAAKSRYAVAARLLARLLPR